MLPSLGCLLVLSASVALALPGDLDPTFGVAGKVGLPGGLKDAQAVVIQPDGKIVVAASNLSTLRVMRYEADGTLDAGFGVGGMAAIDVGAIFEHAKALALQPDGKIVVGGDVVDTLTFQWDFALARLDGTGALDATFGAGGVVRTDFGVEEHLDAIALQPDGAILATGYTRAPGFDAVLARYDSTGVLDPGFGVGGAVIGATADAEGGDVLVQPDGKIVVVATSYPDIALSRHLADGSLDATFGTGGIAVVDVGIEEQPGGAALQPDGKIVVTGLTVPPLGGAVRFLLTRLDSDGTLDPSFGTGGVVQTFMAGAKTVGRAVLVEPDGKIVVAFGSGASAIGVGRWLPNGDVDVGFAPCVQTITYTASIDEPGSEARDVARQADGKLVVTGDAAVVRYGTAAPLACATASKLKVVLSDGDPTNRAVVTWKTDAPLDVLDFGDPLTTTDLSLCVLDDDGGTPRLRMATTILAGGTCGNASCWKLGGSRYKYRRKALATFPVLLAAKLIGGSASGKIRLTGKAEDLTLDGSLPLSLPATVRFVLGDRPGCWDGQIATATRNDDGRFKAKGP